LTGVIPGKVIDLAEYISQPCDALQNFSLQDGGMIMNTGATGEDQFGYSVAINGDYAIVGAPDQGKGAARIYVNNESGIWEEKALLNPTGPSVDDFGWSVGISGNYAIVGAPNDDDPASNSGSVYIYETSDGGDTWSGQRILNPVTDGTEGGDHFGFSVAISGDYAIVGAYGVAVGTYTAVGAAYIFQNDGVGDWNSIPPKTILNPVALSLNPGNAGLNYFGWSVSISGDYAIVGAHGVFGGGNYDAGAVYIFHKDGVGDWETTPYQLITAPYPAAPPGYPRFGWSVSISGDYAIVGEHNFTNTHIGGAYFYHREGLNTWVQTNYFTFNNDNYYFGCSVGISDDYAIVGAKNQALIGLNQGAAYIYKRYNIYPGITTWAQIQEIRSPALLQLIGAFFGSSVAIDGLNSIVGEPGRTVSGQDNAGAAYIYHQD
jgi:hypothetical protein